MGRSLWFRVYAIQLVALLRLAFASAPHFLLNLAGPHNSPVHSSIGTPLTLLLSGLRLLVNIRFQVLFHSPPGVLFTFPSWYYALSVDICVLPWRVVPGFPRGFSCPAVLWCCLSLFHFRLHGFHILRHSFPGISANDQFVWQSSTPAKFPSPVWA